MKKNIILELDRIKSLMKIIVEQGSADITDKQRSEKQLADSPDNFGSMTQYNTIKIGEGTKYPVIYPGVETIIMGDPNPHLKQATGNVSASNFIKDVKIDKNGEEYFIKNGKKYCLPTKKSGFWKLLSDGNFVYQFSNPKNNLIFSMFITPKPSVTLPMLNSDGVRVDETMTGVEAAIRCAGGTNGWEFYYNDGNLFWGKDGKSYDPTNPEHFDTRSTFDEWWDKWGPLVEIVIGFASAFTGAGLAAFLIEAGLVEGAFATAYIAGSSETILSVVLQAGVEAGLMLPIAKYQWDRGQESDAILSIAFCFLPFLTELGPVQKYIKGGIQPSTSKSLIEKVSKFGLSDGKTTQQEFFDFFNNLSASELMLWKATSEQLATETGAKEFKNVLQLYLKKNKDKILTNILGNNKLRNSMDKISNGAFSKTALSVVKQNPIKGTGVIAQLIRIGIPLGGVAIGFSTIYNNLKKMGYNDTQIEKVGKSLEDSLKSSEYLMGLVKIDQKLYKSLVEKSLIEYTSKKENIDGILNNTVVNSKIKSDVLNAAIKIIENDPKTYQPFIKFSQSDDLLNQFFKAGLMTYLEDKGHENVTFKEETPFKSYKFSSSLVPNGELTFKLPTNFTTNKEVRLYDYENGVEIKPI
jgi:hypothetical protein